MFLSEIKDTHTAACVIQHHTDRICKTEPPPCLGGGADFTVREDGGGESHSEPSPLELHASERRGAVRDQGTAPVPHTFSCNRRHTDKRQTDGCRSDNTGHRHEVNKPTILTTPGRGGRVYLNSVYRVMDDSSLRLLEGEWRERMKEKEGMWRDKMRAER